MMALVLIDPPLAQRRDLPIAHTLMNERGFDPETLRNHRHVELDGTSFEFDNCYYR